MKIEYNINTMTLKITDEDRASWRDGIDVYSKMPKDADNWREQRPDWNPYEYFDDGESDQALYKLQELAHMYPVNKTPKEIQEVIENAQKISKIYHNYMNHALAVCLDPKETK